MGCSHTTAEGKEFALSVLKYMKDKCNQWNKEKNLGFGLTLSALYILFSTVSTTFSVNGVMSPFMSVWLPNFIFLAIGIVLYVRVSR